jgi:hypothetical protein
MSLPTIPLDPRSLFYIYIYIYILTPLSLSKLLLYLFSGRELGGLRCFRQHSSGVNVAGTGTCIMQETRDTIFSA